MHEYFLDFVFPILSAFFANTVLKPFFIRSMLNLMGVLLYNHWYLILAILTKRVIDKGHSIKFKNKYYRLINRVGSPIYFNHGTTCIVIKSFDNKLYATVDDNIFALSENFDKIVEVKPKKVYIPRMDHPWKRKLFEKFIEKQEHRFEMVS